MCIGGVGHINEPELFKPALQRTGRTSHAVGDNIETGTGGEMINESGKHRCIGDVAAVLHAGCAALFASPSGGAFAGGAVAFHFTAAVAAWLILWHCATTPRRT